MLDERMNERALDQRIVRALEREPDPEIFIADGFVARAAARVPARRTVSLTPTHYGRNLMSISMAVLLVILLTLALSRPDSSAVGMVLEWCLCAQLIALAVWLSIRRWV